MLPTLPEKYRDFRTEKILQQLSYTNDLKHLFMELGIAEKTILNHMRYCSPERDELLAVITNLLKENARLKDELDQAQEEIAVYLTDGFPT